MLAVYFSIAGVKTKDYWVYLVGSSTNLWRDLCQNIDKNKAFIYH
jgi:hypothetical protein